MCDYKGDIQHNLEKVERENKILKKDIEFLTERYTELERGLYRIEKLIKDNL